MITEGVSVTSDGNDLFTLSYKKDSLCFSIADIPRERLPLIAYAILATKEYVNNDLYERHMKTVAPDCVFSRIELPTRVAIDIALELLMVRINYDY